MNGRRRKRPSLLPFGRNRFILGIVLIFALSFGLVYYFVGHKERSSANKGKEASATAEPQAVSPENKKVLPPASTDSHGDTASGKAQQAPVGGGPEKGEAGTAQSPVKPTAEDKGIPQTAERSGQSPQPQAETATAGSAQASKPEEKKVDQGSSKSSKADGTSGKVTSKRLYTIQFGALPTKKEAEQLQKRLQARGLKAHIVNRGEEDPLFRVRVGTFKNKRDAERQAASIHKRTGLSYFVTVK